MSDAISDTFTIKSRTFRVTPVPPTRDRYAGRNEVLALAAACRASKDEPTGKFILNEGEAGLPNWLKAPHTAIIFLNWLEYPGDDRFCKCVQWDEIPSARWVTSTRELNHILPQDHLYLVSEYH